MKYQIGQQVWRASFDISESYVTCPDCAGSGIARVMLPDDTIVSIECEGCRRGYYPPTGRISTHGRKPTARPTSITGLEMRGGKTEWQTVDSYRVDEEDLFDNEEDAFARATQIAAEHDRQERERINHKEKPLKSWAWHARYHKKCIQDAEKQIAWHTAKLAVARVKIKEDNTGKVAP
jgi:hypothetical protein